MTSTIISLLGIASLFVLVFLQVPLAFALLFVGVVAFAAQTSLAPALTFLASEPANVLASIDIASIPLFLLMGMFVGMAGISRDIYTFAAVLFGHRPGGLAYATMVGSSVFGAVCGSSTATVATFTRVALPEMLARKYSPSFSGATIAAGGALKALIPPSIGMLLYCAVAKTYIFDVFLAAIVPAILTIGANLVAIALVVRARSNVAPTSDRASWSERKVAFRRAVPGFALIGIVFGGLYSGTFTVNEAASVAALVAFVFAIYRRAFSKTALLDGLKETALTIGMLYFILIGSSVFTYFISFARLPEELIGAIGTLGLAPIAIIGLMLIAYLILGSVFDELAAMIITLPFALPIIIYLGYDPIWWAIINVVIIELGLIIPPIGIVILIINAMAPSIPLQKLYWDVVPFIAADLVVLSVLTLFPIVVLWLPTLMRM